MARERLSEEQRVDRVVERRRVGALEAEAAAARRERKQREWTSNGMWLTYEEAAAGEPCRACGQLVIDRLGSWPLRMDFTDADAVLYDAMLTDLRVNHSECDAGSWSLSGSRALHCNLCCPPPPFSPGLRAELASALETVRPAAADELDTWSLALTCGHWIESVRHRTSGSWPGSTTRCPTCQATRGIEAAERVREAAARREEMDRRQERALERARAALAAAEANAEIARQTLAAIEAEAAWAHRDESGLSGDGGI